MVSTEQSRKARRTEGLASILAIGTATPPQCFYQADYPDYLFPVTNNDHQVVLKEKFKKLCEKTMIKKRYLHVTEDVLKSNPNIGDHTAPSLDVRQDIVNVEVPRLGEEASSKAIREWGLPKLNITHLIFCTTSCVDVPGADFRLTKLLGLCPSVNRIMIYQQGCYAGGTALRIAKDIAENNRSARILVVCCENNVFYFQSPADSRMDNLVSQAIFGDGAAALIVGSYPDLSLERPLFQLVSAAQTIIPESDEAITAHVREVGLTIHLSKEVPTLIGNNIENILKDSFEPLGISDWNSLFWIAHPGGPAILNQMELKLGLKQEKLKVSRNVLNEYGNMSSVSVLFILNEMRNGKGHSTTGEGLDWGVLFAFGPGLTVETLVLHSFPSCHLNGAVESIHTT